MGYSQSVGIYPVVTIFGQKYADTCNQIHTSSENNLCSIDIKDTTIKKNILNALRHKKYTLSPLLQRLFVQVIIQSEASLK
jgi:hypothetical protein